MFVESEILELKEKFTEALIRDIVAFLNTEGGDIYLGVADWGEIKGIPKIIDKYGKEAFDIHDTNYDIEINV